MTTIALSNEATSFLHALKELHRNNQGRPSFNLSEIKARAVSETMTTMQAIIVIRELRENGMISESDFGYFIPAS